MRTVSTVLLRWNANLSVTLTVHPIGTVPTHGVMRDDNSNPFLCTIRRKRKENILFAFSQDPFLVVICKTGSTENIFLKERATKIYLYHLRTPVVPSMQQAIS
jgi:hypothetical protein